MNNSGRPVRPVPGCDWRSECADPIAYIDAKGYVYCASHGPCRQGCGIRCRKLRLHEIRRLQSGKPLARY